MTRFISGASIAFAMLATSQAGAHVMLKDAPAAIGTTYKAVFAVPHGCNGTATTRISVQIPEGVIVIEPQATPGWKVETTSGKYASGYAYRGGTVAEGVREVVWSGGKLGAHDLGEFVIDMYLTDGLKPDSTLYFPVVQECEQGTAKWVDIPAAGHAGHDHGMSAAPGVKLIAKP